MSVTPFVVGNWVKGRRFYGRGELIAEILQGNRNVLWLLGTRRIGKTSLLRQVEFLAASSPDARTFPMFWDLQAASTPQKLHESFAEYLEDAEDRLEEHGIELDDVIVEDDLFRSMKQLRRALRRKDLGLLILCDEVEKLIELDAQDRELLTRLREMMQRYEDVRTVIASTIQLWKLAEQQASTSPFLHGISPLYIHNLTDRAAEALIRQVNLPDQSRPRIDDPIVERIRVTCDNHPYLIQLLCKRYLELGDIDEAIDQVGADPMVSFFFSVDFDMLSNAEREILRVVSEHDSSTSNSIQEALPLAPTGLASSLHRLEHLGYVRRGPQRRYVLINRFFRRWFKERTPVAAAGASPNPSLEMTAYRSTVLADEVQLGLFDDRYDLLERVGKGATGVVYKAEDRLLRTTIAVKLLRPEYAQNEEALERLRREIVLSRDISHPNVVRIWHLGAFDRWKYLTMQWVGGPTLAEEIDQGPPMPFGRIVRYASTLASALGAAHDLRVLHRDVKPHNVLIDEQDVPCLADFGLARLVDEPGMTRSGVFLGTPDYASPEQARSLDLDARSDLYALGVVMYHMTTGDVPFKGETIREVLDLQANAAPRDPLEVRPDTPPALRDVVLTCMEKDPDRRFQTAAELEAALGAL